MKSKSGDYLRAIGVFKLFCAVLLGAVGLGLFQLLGQDWGPLLEHLVKKLNLDPEHRYITVFVEPLINITPQQLKLIDAGAFFYALLQFAEGIGLFYKKHWAEYLTVIATSSLIPFEVYEIIRHAHMAKVIIFVINVVIVVYLVMQLMRDRKARQQAR